MQGPKYGPYSNSLKIAGCYNLGQAIIESLFFSPVLISSLQQTLEPKRKKKGF